MTPVETLLAEVACRADDSMYHHERTDDFPCAACKSLAAEQAKALRDAGLLAWVPNAGTIEDDLRSRLGCVMEATWWDRPYDTRLDAIRGMCDLTTDGMTPASDVVGGAR